MRLRLTLSLFKRVMKKLTKIERKTFINRVLFVTNKGTIKRKNDKTCTFYVTNRLITIFCTLHLVDKFNQLLKFLIRLRK